LFGLLVSAVRRWVTPAVAWLLAALFATTPMVQLVTGSLFVENLLAAMIFGAMAALWIFGESGERRFLYLAAALGGTAVAVKFGALAFVIPALICAAVEIRRHWKMVGARWLLAASLLVIAALPPYAIAWYKTGNPLFLFLNARYPSRLLPPNAEIGDTRFHRPLTWSLPYDLTFRSNLLYEGQDGSFGFQYLVLAPLALLALLVATRRRAVAAAFVALTGIILILRSEPNARYLYPALPLLFVPFAALLAWAAAHQRMLARSLIAFTIACAALNACFFPASGWYHKDFYGPFTNRQRAAYVGVTAPFRKTIDWLNATHPRVAVLLTQDSFNAGLGGDVYENHWHQLTIADQIRRASGMDDLHQLLGRWKIAYLIARKPTAHEVTHPAALRELLDNCTVPEYEFRMFYVARLEQTCRAIATPAPLQPVLTATRGVYDDLDPVVLFRGDWERGDRFDGAFQKTVAYASTPGDELAFAFQGGAVTYLHTRAPNRGIAAITIDGVPRGNFDLYSATIQWQSRLTFDRLGPGRHVLVIRATGESRPGSDGNFVDLDAFEVK
jgi:hypothetical protein